MNPSEMSGLELVQAMVEGTLAHPAMADTIPMRATEAARGHVRFTVRADERHLNRSLTEPRARRCARRRSRPWR
jgi:acyl-coenzyme A thioesterase PaaI-like protein